MHQFLELIEEERKKHGISERKLCIQAGINRATYRNSMRHMSRALERVEKMLELLGWDLDAIKTNAPINIPIRQPKSETCIVEGCGRKVKNRNYCQTHYRRWRTGIPLDVPIRGQSKCTVPGCTRKHKSYGYCNTHYYRWKNGIPLDLPPLRVAPPSKAKARPKPRPEPTVTSLVDPDSLLAPVPSAPVDI